MKCLAISGSVRKGSTNTALLEAVARLAAPDIDITLYDGIQSLPIFSPDLGDENTPQIVLDFAAQVGEADGLIFSSPEYVHSLPGGLKNAIDWLVPRLELVDKPVALIHASHRGDLMLDTLRDVLQTVTGNYDEENFLRFDLMNLSPPEIFETLSKPDNADQIRQFLNRLNCYIQQRKNPQKAGF